MNASPIPLFKATCGTFHPIPDTVDLILPENSMMVSLDEWTEKSKKNDVIVRGWPHNTRFFDPHYAWLSKELTPNQGDYALSNDNDVVLHCRLGDYFDRHKLRFGYPLEAIYGLLSRITYGRCLIVTDTPDSYLVRKLETSYRGLLVARDVAHDYRTLYHAPRLIMSPSTFSWWAAWTGKAKEVYQPYEMGRWKKDQGFALDLSGQQIKRFDKAGNILEKCH